jgi:hypothetical protein
MLKPPHAQDQHDIRQDLTKEVTGLTLSPRNGTFTALAIAACSAWERENAGSVAKVRIWRNPRL